MLPSSKWHFNQKTMRKRNQTTWKTYISGIVTYFYFFKGMPKRKKNLTNEGLIKMNNGDRSHNNSFSMKSLSSEQDLAKKDDEDDLHQVSRPDFLGPWHREWYSLIDLICRNWETEKWKSFVYKGRCTLLLVLPTSKWKKNNYKDK